VKHKRTLHKQFAMQTSPKLLHFLLFLDKIQKGRVNRQPDNEAAVELNNPFYGWSSSNHFCEGFRVGRLSMRSVNEA